MGTKGERAWRWFYPNTTGGPCRHAAKWMPFAPQVRAAQNRIEPAQSAGVKGRRACWIQAKNSLKPCTERRSVGTPSTRLSHSIAQKNVESVVIVGDEWQPESLAGLDKGERWAGRNFAPCKADGKKPLGCTDKLNGCVPANGVLRLQDTPKKLTPDQRQKLEQLLGQTERTELHAT